VEQRLFSHTTSVPQGATARRRCSTRRCAPAGRLPSRRTQIANRRRAHWSLNLTVKTAATGVVVIPAVPYLQGIVLDKEERCHSRCQRWRLLSILSSRPDCVCQWPATPSSHSQFPVSECGLASPSASACLRRRFAGGSSPAYCC